MKTLFRRLTTSRFLWALIGWLLLTSWCGAAYDPLAVTVTPSEVKTVDLTLRDSARQRDLPIRVYLPPTSVPSPVVLFSHGLGGNRSGSVYLGQQWAARGYVAVFVQHPGSDDSVWKGKPLGKRLTAMNEAASAENFKWRVEDIPAVLDQLERLNAELGNSLAGRMDLKRVGMSGHSFGAVTTQAVSGQSFPGQGTKFTDARIQAAVAFSPSSPRVGDSARAFGSVKIPWMLMTGTLDVSPIGHIDVASRLAVYPALKGIPKYELVLHDGQHSAFTDRGLPGEGKSRNPNHHRLILALSTAFWDAYLRGDAAALQWLQGPGPRSLMEASDGWKMETPAQATPQ